jgi:site-specific DNA-cytosine methylase
LTDSSAIVRAVDERDVELFAGAGGFSEGAAMLGLWPLGIEWDDAACATRRARGHETLQADVSALDPCEFAPVRLMIAAARDRIIADAPLLNAASQIV